MSDDQAVFLDCTDYEAEEISEPKKPEKEQPANQPQKSPTQVKIDPDSSPEFEPFNLTKEPSVLKVNEFGVEPSDIDLGNSLDNLNTPDQLNAYDQYNAQECIGCSVYLQNVDDKIYYEPLPAPSNQKYPSISQSPQSKITISMSKSSHEERQSKSRDFAKKPLDSGSKSEKSEHSDKNQGNLSDSSLGIDIPAARALKYPDFRGSLSSNSSGDSGSNWSTKPRRYIEKFQIISNTKQATFVCNDNQEHKKTISEAYLSYLQKYFFYNFNILLPMHIPQALEKAESDKVYLNIYFDYIVSNYSQKLLQFFERSHFKEPAAKTASTAQSSATTLQSKFFEYKNMIISKIYQGMDTVESTIKRIKGEVTTPLRLLERLFFKQIEMVEKHHRARQKLEDVLGENSLQIHPSVYEKGAIDTKLYVLMCLRWLVGFELTISMVKERQTKADEVQNEKLELLLAEFEGIQERQKISKMAELQQRVRSIYEG